MTDHETIINFNKKQILFRKGHNYTIMLTVCEYHAYCCLP